MFAAHVFTHPSVGYVFRLHLSKARSEADLQPDIVSFGAVMSACEKAREWQKAMAIFHCIRAAELEPDSWTNHTVLWILNRFCCMII